MSEETPAHGLSLYSLKLQGHREDITCNRKLVVKAPRPLLTPTTVVQSVHRLQKRRHLQPSYRKHDGTSTRGLQRQPFLIGASLRETATAADEHGVQSNIPGRFAMRTGQRVSEIPLDTLMSTLIRNVMALRGSQELEPLGFRGAMSHSPRGTRLEGKYRQSTRNPFAGHMWFELGV